MRCYPYLDRDRPAAGHDRPSRAGAARRSCDEVLPKIAALRDEIERRGLDAADRRGRRREPATRSGAPAPPGETCWSPASALYRHPGDLRPGRRRPPPRRPRGWLTTHDRGQLRPSRDQRTGAMLTGPHRIAPSSSSHAARRLRRERSRFPSASRRPTPEPAPRAHASRSSTAGPGPGRRRRRSSSITGMPLSLRPRRLGHHHGPAGAPCRHAAAGHDPRR